MRLVIRPDGISCEESNYDEYLLVNDRNDSAVLKLSGNSYYYNSGGGTDLELKFGNTWISIRDKLKEIDTLNEKVKALEQMIASICGEVNDLNTGSGDIKWQ
jgi:hypothetical protein